mmetsp:Transcript_32110/g.54789  ORF Transcript_32110/g.54789 Transcript_32110/m.54789 type:complete len:406 (-) Transcript_32110:154-1371(-)|eukprot:CAMPEP_0183711398 /NCGR_PEP_ID=MMETSP0737-20130205/6905_1 /TAXON_ID=385413 /ORGANISM="Thalassiosira miniscula, Strain CCMP1093" /LENGTH=405 /DNA_ID=CAMNT_0025939897 /DNA_START=328 /DNA_END=1545 /DNA_ORIENTATION=+
MVDASTKCSVSPTRSKKNGVDGDGASDLVHPQVNSATAFLLRKALSGTSCVANALWDIYHELCLDEAMIGISIIEGMNAQALAEVASVTNSMLSATVFPYFNSALKILEPNDCIEERYTPDICAQANDLPATSDVSESSSCEQNMEINEGGLMLRSSDFNIDENAQRLDYVITQVDVSRMARAASRRLNVESIHQLPMITYRSEDTLICSCHEEENVDDFLLRNARIIEDYFDNTEDKNECPGEDGPSEFSWMMVPNDPKEDTVTRMSNSIHGGEIPDSISICKSNASANMECDDVHGTDTFEYCVICEEPFKDGESLRVLPCQHLFHCSCVDKWVTRETRENSIDCCIVSGCPMCNKLSPEVPPQEVLGDFAKDLEVQSSDDAPMWALSRLGNLLPRNETSSSD